MQTYKKNRPVTGEYDRGCAAKCVNGTFIGKEREGVAAFLGVPFALPPVKELRWKKPQPVLPSEVVFEAFYNGPTSIQTKLDSERASFYYQSEDCLYLNVWTAEGFSGENRPVMVFIHGGNYGWGGTADPLYDGHNFVKAHPEIVLVTIAYRVGIAGFIDFSEVPGGDEYRESGNLGLLDQICALRYVKDNIKAFGGDPDNVTIFGESAGGGSVSILPLIPAAKGLFKRVIAESGSVALSYSKKECLPLTRHLLEETGAKCMDDLLALTEAQLIAVNDEVGEKNNFPERDGVTLPLDLYESYDNNEAFPVDMLVGTNADELRYWIQDVGGLAPYRLMSRALFAATVKGFDVPDRRRAVYFLRMQEEKGRQSKTWQITEFFNDLLFRLPALRQADAHSKNGNRVYTYYWDYPSALPNLKACHAVELAYVFNNLNETIYTGDNINAALAARVQEMWVNFAKTGDPSTDFAKWAPYSEKSRSTMIIGKNIRLEYNFLDKERKCLYPLLKYNVNGNSYVPDSDIEKLLKITAIAAGACAAAFILYKVISKSVK